MANCAWRRLLAQFLLLLWASTLPADCSIERYCTAWQLNVEINNVRGWGVVPSGCVPYVWNYMRMGQYTVDFQMAINESMAYLESLSLLGDGKDVWVFDIDETALSNIGYYAQNDHGGINSNSSSPYKWVLQAKSTALQPTLRLYNELIAQGVKVFFITGRQRSMANATVQNLQKVGYSGWSDIIYKEGIYESATAQKYKSAKRKELVKKFGYRIWGNVGDQWSDISGTAAGARTFKLPNPMYFIA